jgi:flagellar hook-associated protein 1 FlgK
LFFGLIAPPQHGTRLATSFSGNKAFGPSPVSLNGIAASALSALKTNSTALGVVANNVTNLNTPGYARRVVNLSTLSSNGQLMGVDIANVQRVADQFLTQETYSAGGSSSQYDMEAQLFSQLNGQLGGPGDNQSLSTGLTDLASAFATASQAPTSAAGYTGVANALQNLGQIISNTSNTITALQGQIDGQVRDEISGTNTLIKQIYDINQQIKSSAATNGNADSALEDQRDVALTALSKIIGIRVTPQSDGSVNVSTTDGVNLISNTYATLSYNGGAANGTYSDIQIQDVNPQSGQLIGVASALDPHLSGGSLKGMIDMRDQTLGGLSRSLGNLALNVAQAFNAQSNANAAFPPPTSLTGRQTGLLSGDALNFTGKTTIAVTDSSGNLVSRVDVDFGAGTLSVDGGPSSSIGTSVGSFVTALNGALGSNGSASFSAGKLTIAATGSNGVVVQDDASSPSSRGGTSFSQFFGLNDLFQGGAPSILATGLSGSDASGLAAGGNISLSLKGPEGDIVKQVSVTTTAGMTVSDVITALNTAMGGAATFTLGSNGAVTTSLSALYPNYQLNVTNDTTQRGSTGVSFTQMFGIGDNQLANQAIGFQVVPAVANAPQRIGFATPSITPSTVAGGTVVLGGDSSGAIALQNVITASRSFAQAGGLSAQTSTLSDYAATFYQSLSTQSNAVTSNQTTQDDRLTEAQTRLSSSSGVNLDEELTHLTAYQQAYAAGARILTVVDQLYQTLLNIQ